MKSINIDIEGLQSAVSYFSLSSKELDELNYRLKVLGNELFSDIKLETVPEFEQITMCYNELSDNIYHTRELFENMIDVLMKLPEIYSDIERRSVEKINALIYKNDKYHSMVSDESLAKKILGDTLKEESEESLIDIIQKNIGDIKPVMFDDTV